MLYSVSRSSLESKSKCKFPTLQHAVLQRNVLYIYVPNVNICNATKCMYICFMCCGTTIYALRLKENTVGKICGLPYFMVLPLNHPRTVVTLRVSCCNSKHFRTLSTNTHTHTHTHAFYWCVFKVLKINKDYLPVQH